MPEQIFTENLQNVRIATDDGSDGFHGNVIQFLESSLDTKQLWQNKNICCGPTLMLNALTELAKRKKYLLRNVA